MEALYLLRPKWCLLPRGMGRKLRRRFFLGVLLLQSVWFPQGISKTKEDVVLEKHPVIPSFRASLLSKTPTSLWSFYLQGHVLGQQAEIQPEASQSEGSGDYVMTNGGRVFPMNYPVALRMPLTGGIGGAVGLERKSIPGNRHKLSVSFGGTYTSSRASVTSFASGINENSRFNKQFVQLSPSSRASLATVHKNAASAVINPAVNALSTAGGITSLSGLTEATFTPATYGGVSYTDVKPNTNPKTVYNLKDTSKQYLVKEDPSNPETSLYLPSKSGSTNYNVHSLNSGNVIAYGGGGFSPKPIKFLPASTLSFSDVVPGDQKTLLGDGTRSSLITNANDSFVEASDITVTSLPSIVLGTPTSVITEISLTPGSDIITDVAITTEIEEATLKTVQKEGDAVFLQSIIPANLEDSSSDSYTLTYTSSGYLQSLFSMDLGFGNCYVGLHTGASFHHITPKILLNGIPVEGVSSQWAPCWVIGTTLSYTLSPKITLGVYASLHLGSFSIPKKDTSISNDFSYGELGISLRYTLSQS